VHIVGLRRILLFLFTKPSDGEHEEQLVQWPGQQQPGQQWQQQPSTGATNHHAESVDAGYASDAQSSAAKPAGSPAATTTTTLVQTWRILEDLSYHFLTSQGPDGSSRLAEVNRKEARDCPVQ
jgi:hypothetical protein